VHAQLRRAVNQILKENGIGLKLHSMELIDMRDKVAVASRCCIINGHFVCGPQCGGSQA
jgi:hypothetical protein